MIAPLVAVTMYVILYIVLSGSSSFDQENSKVIIEITSNFFKLCNLNVNYIIF